MPVQPNRVLSHYRLVEKIGEGGMGVVWKALDTKLNRHIALKLLPGALTADPERRRRFVREARTAAAVTHLNIVTIYEIDESDGVTFIAMELVEGRSLASVIGSQPIPIPEALRIATEIAEGLARAHQDHIVHRDLKPENIIIGVDGHPRILDFGLAKLVEHQHEALRSQLSRNETRTEELTREGRILGTPAYMSPEQARGEVVDERSDLFSFGVMLYQMVTGRLPFQGHSQIETLAAILHKPAMPASRINSTVSSRLDDILGKCLEKDPGARYQTSQELVVDLRRLRRDLESDASRSYEAAREALKPRRQRAWAMVLVGTSIVIAIGLAAWWVVDAFRLGTATTADARTILILPLEVRGQAEGADYVGRAFAEAIAMNLARAKNLSVRPVQDKGQAGQGKSQSPVRAALDAGAGRLVTGAVIRDAKGLHASLSLLDSEGSRILWGTQKSADVDDLPGLAASMAHELSTQLGAEFPKLYGPASHAVFRTRMAASPDLIEALRALRRHDLAGGLAATKRLVESFPDEPEARRLHLASLFATATEFGPLSPQRQEFERGAAALTRLDPNHPSAHQFRAVLQMQYGEYREAAESFTKILSRTDLAPAFRANVVIFRGLTYSLLGNVDAALADLEEALPLDPANDVVFAAASNIMWNLDRLEESLKYIRIAITLNPESSQNNSGLGQALYLLRRWEEAVPPLKKACEINALQSVCAFQATALLRAGHGSEAKAAAQRAAALPETYFGAYNLAGFHAVSGDRSGAIRLLRRAFELGVPVRYEDLMKEQDFVSLHGDPEFEQIAAGIKGRSPK
jgi:eukaryotic-like serine/threonine-protein kinase